MRMDVKLPLGMIFSIMGLILICSGVFYKNEIVAKLGFNLNLWWGALVFFFGFLMLIFYFRSRKAVTGKKEG